MAITKTDLKLPNLFINGVDDKDVLDLNEKVCNFIISERGYKEFFYIKSALLKEIINRSQSVVSKKKSVLYVKLEQGKEVRDFIFKTYTRVSLEDNIALGYMKRDTLVQNIICVIMMDFKDYYFLKKQEKLDIEVIRTFLIGYEKPIGELIGTFVDNLYYYQVEETLGHFLKYNNNSTFVDETKKDHIFHTFAHFSFIYTGCCAMCVDLQGDDKNLTDIQFNTKKGGLTNCDLGKLALYLSIGVHTCNSHCEKIGLVPLTNFNEDRNKNKNMCIELTKQWEEMKRLKMNSDSIKSLGFDEKYQIKSINNFSKLSPKLDRLSLKFKQLYKTTEEKLLYTELEKLATEIMIDESKQKEDKIKNKNNKKTNNNNSRTI